VGIVTGLAICAAVLYYIIKGFKYVNFESALKDEATEERKLSLYYPGFLCIHRLLTGLLMGILFDVRHRVFVIFVLQLIYTVFCFTKNPFKRVYMFIRQLICELTTLFAIIVIILYEYTESEEYHTVWMWTEVVMVIVCVVISYSCIVKELWSHIQQ
jgi:hypothetical protein